MKMSKHKNSSPATAPGKNEQKKKIWIAAAACLLVMVMAFTGTYAYLITHDRLVNSFRVGETVIEIVEKFTPPPELAPGSSFDKKVQVKNTGNLPCYARIRVDFSDSRAQEFCEELDINTADWEYSAGDGYYYYKTLLQPGERSTALFERVTVKTYQDAEGTIPYTAADLIDFDILVYAEARQHTDHDDDCDGVEYRTVWQ